MPTQKVPPTPRKMHAGEVDTDVALVQRLLAAQFPEWAGLPIEPLRSTGTDNAIYRIGDEMAARLPRVAWAAPQVEKEQRWLPRLASHLPLAVPAPLAQGLPDSGYPYAWSVYRWLEGESAAPPCSLDLDRAALDLARFILALQHIDTAGGPPSGEHNSFRGAALGSRDALTRAALVQLRGSTLDVERATAVWDAALALPPWSRPPVWIHGDLQPGNLLVQQRRLSAVIDFGLLGVGDPAGELIVAWNLLTADTRPAFRAALQVDDATWARGRAWALSVGLIALPYYQTRSPELARQARHTIDAVLADGSVS